jgi:hypothetical protein
LTGEIDLERNAAVFRRLLGQDGSSGEVRAVCFDTERTGIVRRGQYWSGSDRGLQGVKYGLLFRRPTPLHALPGEVEKGTGMMREVLNEPTVEVGETKEALDFLFIGRSRPFCYSGNLGWVHLYGVVRHNHPEVFNLGFLKLALVRFQEELVLFQKC